LTVVYNAGTDAHVHQNAVTVMAEVGIGISAQMSDLIATYV